MVDWKSKLTSRKFWAAVAEFVTMLIIALGGAQETATQITALIMAGAAVIAYIIGEGLADAAGAKANGVVEHVISTEKPEASDVYDDLDAVAEIVKRDAGLSDG